MKRFNLKNAIVLLIFIASVTLMLHDIIMLFMGFGFTYMGFISFFVNGMIIEETYEYIKKRI